MKFAAKLCALLLMATMALVGQTSTSPKPKKVRQAPVTAADVQSLRDALAAQQSALAAQQQQIQALQNELRGKDQAVQQAQTTATDASSKVEAVQTQANRQQQTVGELKSDVTDMKSTLSSTALTLQETQKTIAEPPTSIHFKGVTLTPGGFVAAESVYRNRALGADINTPFNSVQLPGSSQNALSEFYGSARQSRISLLGEGKLKDMKLTGYYETDFLSAATTSNNNQSNSYSLRQRQLWGQVALENGLTLTGGQMWSLVTETKQGLDNRSEALPMTIDAQYTVGFSWARQYGLRVTKNFNNRFWLGASLENPSTTFAAHGNAANFLLGGPGNGGGLYNPTANYSFNAMPDVIVKAAFQPGFGHYEVFGIFSRFRDRVFPCGEPPANLSLCSGGVSSAAGAYNDSKNGFGLGGNARITLHKQLDLGVHVLGGNGVGRYGTSGLPDATVHADGTLALLRSYQGLATIEWHKPKYDVYLNAGAEYVGRNSQIDAVSLKAVGYGSPLNVTTGCYSETLPSSTGFGAGGLSNCTADTRNLIEGTFGFWYRIYNGPKGRLQMGPQYSYVTRNTWRGTGGAPHGIDNMVLTSFRYYLP